MGHQPKILVWDTVDKKLITEIEGHKFGVLCTEFTRNGKHLVSIGLQHDGFLYVWNWKTGEKLASNKISSQVFSVANC